MTKDMLTEVEKARLEGMETVFNVDLCLAFECPDEGCEECPIRKVIEAQANLVEAIGKAIRDY